uniref:Pro-thyrotropin-releasing hormone n=1 Tax=Pelodiscus sinensis TaxID=13735 RepID=K7FNZ1_PELSI|nr:thyrotropin releasing hormone [Pelodiscus sinensis]|eukprot:XP_006132902.1 thyrotropin releasing hormone [Pelodiscus sinensis]
MISVWLLLLLSLTLSSACVNLGQPIPEANENGERSHLDDILQRAESIILRSILKKAEEEEETNKEPSASQPGWFSKRQHPGKRFLTDLEKRQHPGKREEDDDSDLELQKRQHPGRRSLWDQYMDIPSTQLAYLHELSKRQHPGKRYLIYTKRQHPGKRSWDDELDLRDQDMEKRQHPGKRYVDSESTDYDAPCDFQESFNCSKGSLLLELLDNVNKGRVEEKRQHPGRRFAWEGEAGSDE